MASIRCKMVVKAVLKKLGLHSVHVDLGEIEILEDISITQREQIKKALHQFGLELMASPSSISSSSIK